MVPLYRNAEKHNRSELRSTLRYNLRVTCLSPFHHIQLTMGIIPNFRLRQCPTQQTDGAIHERRVQKSSDVRTEPVTKKVQQCLPSTDPVSSLFPSEVLRRLARTADKSHSSSDVCTVTLHVSPLCSVGHRSLRNADHGRRSSARHRAGNVSSCTDTWSR